MSDNSDEPEEARQETPRPQSPSIGPHQMKLSVVPTLSPRQQTPESVIQEFLLKALAFKTMHFRFQEVSEAHTRTFEWVFEEHTLAYWLSGKRDTGPIYWIAGKPGSGKSTFMRFLYDHSITDKMLDDWAAEKQVAKAGFFFWTCGSREQHSQTGLLRSLLHQLLSKNPELIELTFPNAWKMLRAMPTKQRISLQLTWSAPELMAAFNAFADAALPTKKLCLFIDGMDEFEGDHGLIIDFFKGLCTGDKAKDIKLCLSSRPWAVFQDAFECAVPNLRLQELTYTDLFRYINDNLSSNAAIRRAMHSNPTAGQRLIKTIIRMSDGVFLWARLCLDEIMAEHEPGETTLADLTAHVRSLPSELDDLFHMLLFDDRTEADLAQAADLFSLMQARERAADFVRNDAATSLTVRELCFAIRSQDDERALNDALPVRDRRARRRCNRTINHVLNRFEGLLEIHYPEHMQGNTIPQQLAEARVTYLHRTVRDWLMSPAVFTRLVENVSPGFDAHLRILRSYVLCLKNPVDKPQHHRRLGDLWPDIALAMTHARHITTDIHNIQRGLLNEMERVLSWYWMDPTQDPYDHWARSAFETFETCSKGRPIWQPFLCLAVKFGLNKYVEQELAVPKELSETQGGLQCDDSTPLIAYATEYLCSRNNTIFPLSDPGMVAVLLRHVGETNPGVNHEYIDFNRRVATTAWLTVLRHLRDAKRRGWIEHYDVNPEGTARWVDIVKILIEMGGADMDAVVVEDHMDKEITAMGMMEMLKETFDAVEAGQFKEFLREMKGFRNKGGEAEGKEVESYDEESIHEWLSGIEEEVEGGQ